MELEGTLLLERSPTRRWISIIAIVIPVASVVMLSAWFIRAYIVPPTITIHGPMVIAAAPAAPPLRAEAPVVQPQPMPPVLKAEPAAPPAAPPPAAAAPVDPPSPPMFASLAVAPPNFNNLGSAPPAAFADPASAQVAAAAPTQEADTTAAIGTSEPISGPIPLPRHKPNGPHVSAALSARTVPLPRPRPVTEETKAPDLPAVDRHTID
jgi:hypothetical protein